MSLLIRHSELNLPWLAESDPSLAELQRVSITAHLPCVVRGRSFTLFNSHFFAGQVLSILLHVVAVMLLVMNAEFEPARDPGSSSGGSSHTAVRMITVTPADYLTHHPNKPVVTVTPPTEDLQRQIANPAMASTQIQSTSQGYPQQSTPRSLPENLLAQLPKPDVTNPQPMFTQPVGKWVNTSPPSKLFDFSDVESTDSQAQANNQPLEHDAPVTQTRESASPVDDVVEQQADLEETTGQDRVAERETDQTTSERDSPQRTAMNDAGAATDTPIADSMPTPVYPRASIRQKEQGTVVLQARVTTEGQAVDIRVIESPGFSRLEKAAIRAMEKAHFTPAQRNGIAIEATVTKAFHFKLKK